MPVTTTNTMVPLPEFCLYQDQATELDEIATRISALVRMSKVRGAYPASDAGAGEMSELFDGPDGELVPIQSAWAQQGGKLADLISWVPVDQYTKSAQVLASRAEQLMQQIYSVIGISDLQRGASNPNESATAQRIKGSFGTARLQPRQKPMAMLARDVIRLKAEIIAEHFEPETLQAMTGLEVPAEVVHLLRDQRLRGFRVDIETDSTVAPDTALERQQVTEFVAGTTKFLGESAKLIAGAPEFAPVMFDMLKAMARRSKLGRELEESIDQASQSVMERITAAQQGEKPDPASQRLQIQQAESAQKMQLQAAEAQQDMALKQQSAASDIQIKREQAGADQQLAVVRALQGI